MKITVPLQIIELEDDNYHLVVSSVLPDGNEGFWVVDTGASKTVFDKTLSEYFSIDNPRNTSQLTTRAQKKCTPLELAKIQLKPKQAGSNRFCWVK